MTSQSAISIRNISASYGAKTVVDDASMEVKSGDTFGLIGLNGAGKTTIIKSILGLRTLQSGEILIFGHEAGSKLAKNNVAYLPEHFNPPPFLSGLEFLRFSTQLYKTKYSEDDFIEAALKIDLDIVALSKRIRTYSKGMRQKLGLLATIMADCSTFILDEPMSGLDPAARALTKSILQDAKKDGKTILLSSHILNDMDEICDKVAVLHEHKIRFTGTPAELRAEEGNKSLEDAFLNFIKQNSKTTY